MRNIQILGLALIGFGLAGCENAPFRMEYGWTEERVLSSTWIPPRQESPEPAYCYRTLALADCYQRPQPRQATRLVGFIGPEPL